MSKTFFNSDGYPSDEPYEGDYLDDDQSGGLHDANNSPLRIIGAVVIVLFLVAGAIGLALNIRKSSSVGTIRDHYVRERMSQTTKMTDGLLKLDDDFTKVGNEVRFTATLGDGCILRSAYVETPNKPASADQVSPVIIELTSASGSGPSAWVPVTSKRRLIAAVNASGEKHCIAGEVGGN